MAWLHKEVIKNDAIVCQFYQAWKHVHSVGLEQG
jgi:hypothetical protein